MTAEARRRALALGALAIATFTYVTTETLPIGVLPASLARPGARGRALAGVLTVAPGSTDVAAGGTSTAFNVGIMAGSSAGGALLGIVGLAGLPLVGAVFATAALLLLAAEPRLVRPRVAP